MFAIARQLRAPLGRVGLATVAALAAAWWVQAGPSRADVTATPAWTLMGTSLPTHLVPGSTYASGGDSYVITLTNTGGAATSAPSGGGSTITVVDTLPAGITPDPSQSTGVDSDGNSIKCTPSGQTVTCIDRQDVSPILSDQQVEITIPVDVSAGAASSVVNQVSVSGGGAPSESTTYATVVSSTPASFGLQSFTAQSLNADGTTDTQAGSTPNEVLTGVAFNSVQASNGNIVPAGDLRDTTLGLPPGLVGNPMSVPTCSQAAMDTPAEGSDGACPTDTQVGIADVDVVGPVGPEIVEAPIFNLAAPAGMPAQFGFSVLTSVIHIDFSVRTGGDYGLNATISGTNAGAPVLAATILVWGNPASASHDDARFELGASGAGPGTDPNDPSSSQPIPSTLTPASLLSNPTSCGATPATSISVDDWQAPTSELTSSYPSPDVTGCAAEAFSPSVTAQPTSTVASSPAGLNVDIAVPQSSSPTALAESNLRDVTVTLPAGVVVSPSGANGLQACSAAQIGLNNANAAACPSASAIGTVEVDTPLLATPLVGSVYLAQQTANPFGSLLAVYVTAQGSGVQLKLAGRVTADPTTGQLTTTFDDNPQLPFSALKVDFFGGPNAPLSMPSVCGTYTTTTALSSWSDPTSLTLGSSSFTINSGCMSGFAPTFSAGTTSAKAGAFSPFVLSFSRADTDQYLRGLQVKLPEGMLAKITGVQECTSAELASISSQPGTGVAQEANPSCPAGSQVGTVSVAAGPGTDPYHLTGHVYLTGPYNGGSFGLAVVAPAVAGPLDLGTVVVRQALDINPRTARVTVTSDPFPTILDGIPLQLRDVSVDLNRHHFTVDPTSCGSMAVTGTLSSSAGTSAAVSSKFHVNRCGSLKFNPTLHMKLTGRHQTAVGTHPTLTADLTQPAGQANVRSEKVTLPLSLALDPNNSEHVCSVEAAAKIACPKRTLVGKATALTRILPTPLTGNVYLVQGEHKNKQGQILRTLPTLLIPLRGDNVAINLTAQTSVDRTEHLVTTFPTVPDAAIRSFKLSITGGKRGILVVTGHKSLCAGAQVGDVVAIGHNGKQRSNAVAMTTSACGAATKSKKK